MNKNNHTHRRTRNSFLCSSSTSRLSDVTITLHIHIYHFSCFKFSSFHKISKLSNIITHISIKQSYLLHFKRISIFRIIYKKNTISCHLINFIFGIRSNKRFRKKKNKHFVFCYNHFSMISKDITHNLIWSNKFYNTKFAHHRKNFHDTIIRKFTITIKSNWTSFNRIDRIISSTYTITFIYLRFINPFYIYISSFRIKFIIFFYYTSRLKTKFIYISKNTSFSFSSPNNMPNFK